MGRNARSRPPAPDAASERVRRANAAEVRPDGALVVYWMIGARRASHSFALDRAVDWARRLDKPLVVLEALRVAYPWASDRLHRFVIDGMRDNEEALERAGAFYYPYVEPREGAGKGLLRALAEHASVVVTDDFPAFFLPHMVAAAARQVPVALEVVDGNGLLPLSVADRAFTAASHYRRFVQRELPRRLDAFPRPNAFAGVRLRRLSKLPGSIAERWPRASRALLDGDPAALAALPIDHEVPAVAARGGAGAARARLSRFVAKQLTRYAELRDAPEADGTSRLSPYLHFGHIAAHEVFAASMRAEGWSPDRLAPAATGAREGFWGVGASAEAFLDQLVVWRELSYNTSAKRPRDYDKLASLPAWARETLAQHAGDPRPHRYSYAALEAGRTHDALWNAAQGQLREEGWFHNRVRMLWGKKILEWSPSPQQALRVMTGLMNRWSLDGRDPCSYAGYLWTLGRYDRPWPERPVYGKVRSMSSERTAAKFDAAAYIARYTPR